MTLASNSAEATLKKKLDTAQTVLQLAELCRKFETEQEKVLPFVISPQVRS